MTADDNKSITPRAARTFRILKNGTDECFPGAGSRLHYANRDVDTLTLTSLPAGLLARGDTVTVQYGGSGAWVTVFAGEVDRIVDTRGRGLERVQTVTVAGPWGRMNRLVYRQAWNPSKEVSITSSRVVLGQTATGFRQTMAEQLAEILGFAASKCGFEVGKVDALDLHLPLDETRDITCADAVRRELRFFPKRIVRFDYSGRVPEIQIVEPASADADYVTGIPKTSRVYEYTAHPVSCVDVAVDAADVMIGGRNLTGHQIFPPNGDPDDLDCLHVTVPLSPGSASVSYESFKSVTEDIPDDLTSAEWWRKKHPRLANVLESEITITDAARSPDTYKRIAKSTKGEIEAAGLHCEVSRVTCSCHVKTATDEEDIRLTMDFLTTDATTRTYTWQTGSSSVAGETLPAGLAEALYRQRAQDLVNERMTVRLGEKFPRIGDAADGLFLQSFDVDLYGLTAELSFGQPEHLSAEDMRGLLTGFRQRGFASTARLRNDKDNDGGEDGDEDKQGGIPPIASSEWAPMKKSKATISSGTAASSAGGSSITMDATGGGGSIDLKTSELKGGETVSVHTLTYTDKDGATQTYKVLSDKDIEIKGGGGEGDPPPTGDKSVTDIEVVGPGDDNPYANAKLKITYSDKTENFIQITSASDANVRARAVDGNLEIGVYYK